MNATKQIPVVTPDAGDQMALEQPNSPASLMRRSKQLESQSIADMKYDATAPVREGFQECESQTNEILHSLFLASSVLLLLYAAAPNQG